MIFLLSRLLRPQKRSWLTPLVVILFVFVTSWVLLALLEPQTGIADAGTFWWWFIVTSSTVGYGDVAPESLPGRIVGAYVIVGGIVTLTAIFSKVSEALENARGRRMQGLQTFTGTGHLVVLGYTAGRTEQLVRTMLGDGQRVVLAAWDDAVAEHPMAGEDVFFVRGELTDVEVLQRANIAKAKAVLIDPRSDDEAVTLTVAADEAAPGVHTVVAIRDNARRRTISRVDETARCVEWHATSMITEELADPGITEIYQELMRPEGKGTFSTVVPDRAGEVTYGSWQQRLGERHDATLLAVRLGDQFDVSAAWNRPVPAGAVLFYVAERRLTADDLLGATA